jgi:hypothetical protein
VARVWAGGFSGFLCRSSLRCRVTFFVHDAVHHVITNGKERGRNDHEVIQLLHLAGEWSDNVDDVLQGDFQNELEQEHILRRRGLRSCNDENFAVFPLGRNRHGWVRTTYATNDREKRLGTMTIGEKGHTSKKP